MRLVRRRGEKREKRGRRTGKDFCRWDGKEGKIWRTEAEELQEIK